MVREAPEQLKDGLLLAGDGRFVLAERETTAVARPLAPRPVIAQP
jgi:uncharacterized protein HemY